MMQLTTTVVFHFLHLYQVLIDMIACLVHATCVIKAPLWVSEQYTNFGVAICVSTLPSN